MDDKVRIVNPLIIIQARMGSSRLPGKVMRKINEIPVIGYQINRLVNSGLKIVVAIPDNGNNFELLDYVNSLGIACFEGDELNVLKRFYDAALFYGAKDIIRITGDNPLIDGMFIREQVESLIVKSSRYYYSEGENKRLPLGMSFEMFSFDILKEAYINAKSSEEFEHVTQYMVQNLPGDILNYTINTNYQDHDIRLTIDTKEDFTLFETLVNQFQAHELSQKEIISLFKKHPFLKTINKDIDQIQIRSLSNDL